MLKGVYTVAFVLWSWISVTQSFKASEIQLPSSFNSGTVVGFDQDRFGNLWMVTGSQGMMMYDGVDIKYFNHINGNDNSLLSDRLECLHIDKRGHIWIGSYTEGVSVYDPSEETFVHYVHDEDNPKSIRSNAIRTFVEDENGGIWVGTLNGVSYWNPSTNSFDDILQESEDKNILDDEHVRVLYIDRAGMVWAGTSSPFFGEATKGGLFKINTRTNTVKRYDQGNGPKDLTNGMVTALYEDSRGVFWVGTAGDGLHTMNKELGEFTHHRFDPVHSAQLSRSEAQHYSYVFDHIRYIGEDKFGDVWIGTLGNGLSRYNPKSNITDHFDMRPFFSSDNAPRGLWMGMKTNDDQLWFSSWQPTSSQNVFFKLNVNTQHVNHTIVESPVYSFSETNNGDVYMGSINKLLKLDEADEVSEVITLPDGDPVYFTSMNQDESGNLWIATTSGLVFYEPASDTHDWYQIKTDGVSSDDPVVVNASDNLSIDSVLVATDQGLFLFDKKREEFSPIAFTPANNNPAQQTVSDLLVDSKGNIWVGYFDFGLKKLSRDLESFKDYRFLETTQDGPLTILEDDNDRLWVGNRRSGLQLYDYDKDSFSQVMDKDNLLEDEPAIYVVRSLSDSSLILISGEGAILYNTRTEQATRMESSIFEGFNIVSPDIFITERGEFYLGTSLGFIKYRPDELLVEPNGPRLPSVSKLFVGEENYSNYLSSQEEIVLAHTKNNLSFTLSFVDINNAVKSNGIEYRLKNYDLNWRNGNNDEEVYYYNVPDGSYSFEMRNVDYPNSMYEAASIKIQPAWYNTWWAYCLYTALAIGIGLQVQRVQKRNTIRKEREKAREKELKQAREIEKAYAELKATQEQLIQSEKMASLGELTAGIAHEIQNPLNFVNNFSDVSAEMIDEALEELERDDKNEVKEVLTDIKSNLQKISHHGVRASNIVKGMLDHSRASTGVKEATDINALCDECLRLTYHGLRAKDKSFNAAFETDFDQNLPEIKVISQDIGRVLLNVISNAFYAVDKKKKEGIGNDYEPKVIIKTQKTSLSKEGAEEVSDSGVTITVTDNGIGMSQETIDKVFQPFYTTKPTGQGTGLGMSISYDIVTKGHGGELKVESEEGEGSDFIIILPMENS